MGSMLGVACLRASRNLVERKGGGETGLAPVFALFPLRFFSEIFPMKLIVAIIRPEKLEAVQEALNKRDVYLMTVSDVRGCGRQRGYTEVYRATEYQVRLLPKLKLEIGVNDAFVEATVEAIVHAARMGETGQIGDGKIFVLPLEDCVRIAPANAADRRLDRR